MSSPKKKAAPRNPMLGGLLRLAHQELLNDVTARLAAVGMGDVSPAQYAVCQQLGAWPEGRRVTELAAYAGMSKASMSALVGGLERAGYVERAPDPSDLRAQRVRFTRRGWRFGEAAARAVTAVEEKWAERIGTHDLETLRRILRAIVDTRPGVARSEEPFRRA